MKVIRKFFSDGVGRKQATAISGLMLLGFLVAHLVGNLLLFKGGKAFDEYAHFLESQALLPLMEAGLITIFVLHVFFALRATIENYQARDSRYKMRGSELRNPFAAALMPWTGGVILIFLFLHISGFKFSDRPQGSLFELVVRDLGQASLASAYVVAFVSLGFHLWHGVQSAFQTLGVEHSKYNSLIRGASYAMAALLALGFIVIPLAILGDWLG